VDSVELKNSRRIKEKGLKMEYDNTNRGVMFKNDRKEKETHPDLKGSINIDGKEFWLSGWSRVTGKGDKMLSLSVTPKEAQGKAMPAQAKQTASAPEIDDDMPF
jgi:hypothetical protein